MKTDAPAPFFPPAWQGLIRQISHLSEFGGSVQVITGPAGSGKSTLLSHLQSEWETTPILLCIESDVSIDQFYFSLLEQAGLYPNPGADLGELMMLLRQFAESQLKAHVRKIIAIDDAHLLEDAQLAALVSVLQGQEEAGFGLHLLLLGKPGLAERIDRMPLVGISVHDAEMPEFSPLDMREWIHQHLGTHLIEGWRDGQVQQLWSDARGRPGAILAALKPAEPMEEAHVTVSKKASELGLPWAHIVAVAVLAFALLWAFWARGPDLEGAAPPSEIVSESATPGGEEEPKLDVAKGGVAPVTTSLEEAPKVGAPIPEPPAESASLTQQNSTASPVTPTEPSVPKAPAVTKAPDVTRAPSTPKEAKPVPKPAPPEAAADPVALDEARLLSLPAEQYVLQIMASSQRANLLDYRALQKNADSLAVYRLARDGKILHVLVQGLYRDSASAKAAIARLPAIQQQGGPWPKPLSRVHSEIRTAQKETR